MRALTQGGGALEALSRRLQACTSQLSAQPFGPEPGPPQKSRFSETTYYQKLLGSDGRGEVHLGEVHS